LFIGVDTLGTSALLVAGVPGIEIEESERPIVVGDIGGERVESGGGTEGFIAKRAIVAVTSG
jgi:hypothetical protein